MNRFVALRKQPRTSGRASASLSVTEKRAWMVTDASTTLRAAELRGLGLDECNGPAQYVAGREAFRRMGYIGAYVVDTATHKNADKARELLERDYWIVPNVELSLPGAQATEQRARRLSRAHRWPEESGIEQAHRQGAEGEGVFLGVLDTGCDADHLEFRDRRIDFRYVPLNTTAPLRAVRGFDLTGHGTHVCGILGGRRVGVAPKADLFVASVIESETIKTSLDRILLGLDWMLSQFQKEEHLEKPAIINLSLGFSPSLLGQPVHQLVVNGIRAILKTLVDDFDILPVVAIGNSGPGQMAFPGTLPETLAVGAVDFELAPWLRSGGGVSPESGASVPDIAGYGVGVLSSLERDVERHSWYARKLGTSMASPYVAGVAALIASKDPAHLTGAELRQKLLADALPLPHAADRVGAGLARVR